jgi:hypothetical protein
VFLGNAFYPKILVAPIGRFFAVYFILHIIIIRVLMDCDGNIWEKISNPDFDVSMGSMDGAEVAELIGIYMIGKLMVKFNKFLFGIYRDD